VGIDIVGEEEVQLPDGDVDVVRVDTEAGMEAVRRLFQPLTICTLQGHSLEEDNLNQIQPPHLQYKDTVDLITVPYM
jgi:hypothetical protein